MKTLDDLEALLAAATPGEWRNDTGLSYFDRYGQNFCGYFFRATPRPYILGATFDAENTVSLDDAKRNAELIVLAHNALPALIECAKALRDCHARLRLLVDADRHKMLDAVVEQRAEKALLALDNERYPNN